MLCVRAGGLRPVSASAVEPCTQSCRRERGMGDRDQDGRGQACGKVLNGTASYGSIAADWHGGGAWRRAPSAGGRLEQ